MCPIQKYITDIQQVLNLLPIEKIEQVIGVLRDARLSGRQVFTMGNGGSASTAQHFVCDLAKNTHKPGWPPFRVISLADNIASVTAYANDDGYEYIFAQQLSKLIKPRDVVIGISTSGNSKNVIRANEVANRSGAQTIAFTGFDGGTLGSMVDINICVPSDCIEQVEDVHLMLEHLICRNLREEIEQVPVSSLLLRTISSEFVDELDIRDLLRRVLQLTLEGLGATSGSVLVLNEQGDVIDGALAYQGQIQQQETGSLIEIYEHGLAGWVAANRQGALVSNTIDDPRWLRRNWEYGYELSRSAISVPLMTEERVVGVLTLVHNSAGQFTKEHLALLTAIAVFVSIISCREL